MNNSEEALNNSGRIPAADYESARSIRDKLANTILVCVSVLGAPLIFFSFLRNFKSGSASVFTLHVAVYLCLVSITIYRKKIPVQTKASFIIGGSFIIAASVILTWGIIGPGVAYLIFVSILVTIFYSAKHGTVFIHAPIFTDNY